MPHVTYSRRASKIGYWYMVCLDNKLDISDEILCHFHFRSQLHGPPSRLVDLGKKDNHSELCIQIMYY